MKTQSASEVNEGLEGVIAAATRLSLVDGERGELVIAGHRLEALVERPFEDVVSLLWETAGAPDVGRVRAAAVAGTTLDVLRDAAARAFSRSRSSRA